MVGLDLRYTNSHSQEQSRISHTPNPNFSAFVSGGLFLEPTVPSSFVNLISSSTTSSISLSASGSASSSCTCGKKPVFLGREKRARVGFLTVSLKSDGFDRESKVYLVQNGEEGSDKAATATATTCAEQGNKHKVRLRSGYAMNTSKHLWSGAIAAMVSRSVLGWGSICCFCLQLCFHSILTHEFTLLEK